MVGIEEEQQLNRNGLKRGLKLTRIPRSQKTNHFSANCESRALTKSNKLPQSSEKKKEG